MYVFVSISFRRVNYVPLIAYLDYLGSVTYNIYYKFQLKESILLSIVNVEG